MDIEDAEELVLKALAPLGTEYVNKLKEAFNSNWMDAFQSQNKRGGAYNMPVYGVHPYVLLNYTGTNFDVSSIAHEFGHAMHSYYSDKNQNVLEHSYTLLLAEIASTVNEILLAQYRLENSTDKQEKIALLYDRIETVKSTLFTQAMFAEFEQEVHSRIENEKILNAEKLGNIYVDLCKKYYGEDLIIDEYNKYNWTRIHHFFSCFYVYKYATGISCAIDIASRILAGEEGLVEKYINMLKMGGSKKSLDILKTVGIDLEDSRTIWKCTWILQKRYRKIRRINIGKKKRPQIPMFLNPEGDKMSEVKWTEEQSQAIHEKGSNILVAAAAGSGKTAVLVERIINKIIAEEIDIDKLLVVTFTNAAASEMRERILNAIYKKIEEEPTNLRLQKQITLLNKQIFVQYILFV